MKNTLAHASPITGLSFAHLHRTANAGLAQRLYTDSQVVSHAVGEFRHGRITTANESLFAQANFSEPMTNYAVNWTDPEGYDALIEFIAPNFQAPGDLFEYTIWDNAEAFLSDGTYDDLRAINAEFKTVDYNQTKEFAQIGNRGLRIELDYDRIKHQPNWQQIYTGQLLRRLKRNQARRAAAIAIAAGTAVSFVWNAGVNGENGSQPDIELNAQKIASADMRRTSTPPTLTDQTADRAAATAPAGLINPPPLPTHRRSIICRPMTALMGPRRLRASLTMWYLERTGATPLKPANCGMGFTVFRRRVFCLSSGTRWSPRRCRFTTHRLTTPPLPRPSTAGPRARGL